MEALCSHQADWQHPSQAAEGRVVPLGPHQPVQALCGLMPALFSAAGEMRSSIGQAEAVLLGALAPVCVLRLSPQPVNLLLELEYRIRELERYNFWEVEGRQAFSKDWLRG